MSLDNVNNPLHRDLMLFYFKCKVLAEGLGKTGDRLCYQIQGDAESELKYLQYLILLNSHHPFAYVNISNYRSQIF